MDTVAKLLITFRVNFGIPWLLRRFDIVGRADIAGGRRNVLGRTPPDFAIDPSIVLHPDLPQDLNGGKLSQEKRGCLIIDLSP